MNIGDLIKLNDGDKSYIVLIKKKYENKTYALVTEFNGDIENDKIENVEIDLTKAFLISFTENSNDFLYENDQKIINDLCKVLFKNSDNK